MIPHKNTQRNKVYLFNLSLFLIPLLSFSTLLQAEENQAIGQAPEEDVSHLFLRDSEVLLKPRQLQLSIGFNYNSDENQRSFRKNRNRTLSLPFGISYGVTDNLELNASLSLRYQRNEVIAPTNVSKQAQSGIGDLSLGLSYKVKPETESSPSITTSFGVTAPTAKKEMGSNVWGVSTGLHLSKSIDPAVVFANVGYQHTFKDKQKGLTIQSGDVFSYGFGAGLSINSSVSFSGRVSGSYQLETKRNGNKIIGSSAEPISFIAGMSYRLNRKTRLETNLNLGLSEDAGDVGIGISYIWNL
ncbi:MAG TPA: transporter [Leucothrix mucor]|uniref:Transporter n=1 Tax=Leucothrix mucor TaxID=45248 RepID=A0A7V2WVN0_LEUMU|nr:transporter [Leucothrix mucor]